MFHPFTLTFIVMRTAVAFAILVPGLANRPLWTSSTLVALEWQELRPTRPSVDDHALGATEGIVEIVFLEYGVYTCFG